MPALASNCCRVLPDCRARKPDPAAGTAPAAFAAPETVFSGAAEPVFRAVEELFSAFIDIDREGREEFPGHGGPPPCVWDKYRYNGFRLEGLYFEFSDYRT